MSQSLREQMLKAGLVSKKQVREADRSSDQRQHKKSKSRRKGAASPPSDRATRAVQADKIARDRQLNLEKQARAEARARAAQLQQLVEQHALSKTDGDEYFNFVDAGKVRRVPVDAALRARIINGDLNVVRVANRYELVPSAVGLRIRDCDANALVALGQTDGDAEPDERYKDFEVPDDLIW
jgi:uncharacterized protein YaiL (DUF2058 family)